MSLRVMPQGGHMRGCAVWAMRLVLTAAALCLAAGALLQWLHQGTVGGWPAIDSDFLHRGAMRGFRHLFAQFPLGSGHFWMALGLLVILGAQLLRLGLVFWLFLRGGDRLYILLTLFLLALVLRSFFL